uniref:hypothetical protein n=1 Tax=Aliarcobacter sp. TaxID=2321116 RepID=UPI004048939B
MWYPFKNTINSLLGVGLTDSFKDIPNKKLEKKHYFAVLLFLFSLVFVFVKFYTFDIDSSISIEEKTKIQNELKTIDNRLKNIKLNTQAEELGIPKFHEKYKTINNYYVTAIQKDSFFKSSSKRYFFKKNTQLIVIEFEDGLKYYYANNQILKKEGDK